jgi:hypothetical protein
MSNTNETTVAAAYLRAEFEFDTPNTNEDYSVLDRNFRSSLIR